MTIDPTVLAAAIASLVALIGYLGSQRIQRVERRARLFAEAMRAVDQVHELPFLVWRRADTSEETVQRLGGPPHRVEPPGVRPAGVPA